MLGVYPELAPVLSPSTMFRINTVEGLKGNPQFMLRHSKSMQPESAIQIRNKY